MKKYMMLLVLLCVAGGSAYLWHHGHIPLKKPSAQATNFNKKQYPTLVPSSIWIVVNKQHPLKPREYAPTDLVFPNVPSRVPGNESMQLRKVAATALEALFAGARKDGITLKLSSGYRSFSFQQYLYNRYVKAQGQAVADTSSARPGYSEHQTGLAADVEPIDNKCEVDPCFVGTPEAKWLAANAYKYGFIIRYTKESQDITGYEYEPWHIRYIGAQLANELRTEKIATLEQFFGISGGTTYAP